MSRWRQKAAIWLLLLNGVLAGNVLASLPPPVITVQPVDQYVPLLGVATFSVTATSDTTMSYQWYKNGSAILLANSSSYSILSVLNVDAGTYCVKVSNSGGSVMSANATLNILTPPSITNQPQSQTVIQGHRVTFSVGASGSPPPSYQWNFNGAAIAGATSSALTLSSVGPGQAGTYTVLVANSAGSVTSAAATLTVLLPPRISTEPQSQQVVQGQGCVFSVVASGTSPLSYQWRFNGTPVPGATTSALALTNVGPSQAGNYNVVITNVAGSDSSQTATLTVLVPPGIAAQPLSQSLVQGQSYTLSVSATGTAPLSYQWSFNGAALAGATNSTLALTNVQVSQSGTYAAVVTNSVGTASSQPASLNVSLPMVSLSAATGAPAPNGFTVQMDVPVGLTYVIWASTDLQAWTALTTNVASTGTVASTATVSFTDAAATNYPQRFYRAEFR